MAQTAGRESTRELNLERPAEVFQRAAPLSAAVLRFALEPLALLRDFSRFSGIRDHEEGVAG
jgi:hypothetical protein